MNEDVEQKLDDCFEAISCSNTPFNKWEEDFLYSIKEQWIEHKFITQKQQEILLKCWEKI